MKRLCVFGFVFLLLCGCSGIPLDVDLSATHILNQSVDHQSLPVQVRLYQLQDSQPFLQANFHDLWRHDERVLGKSFLDKREVTVNPNEQLNVTLRRKNNARYLGIVAIFRKPMRKQWRVMEIIPQGLSLLPIHVQVKLHHYQIEKVNL